MYAAMVETKRWHYLFRSFQDIYFANMVTKSCFCSKYIITLFDYASKNGRQYYDAGFGISGCVNQIAAYTAIKSLLFMGLAFRFNILYDEQT